MKFWGSSEAIISKTLQLLSDLSIGYPFVFVDDFKVGGSVAEWFKAQVLKSSVPEFNSRLYEQKHLLSCLWFNSLAAFVVVCLPPAGILNQFIRVSRFIGPKGSGDFSKVAISGFLSVSFSNRV